MPRQPFFSIVFVLTDKLVSGMSHAMAPSIATEKIKVDYVPVADLNPFNGNPRKISPREMNKLRRSIKEFGFVDPLIARTSDNLVIGGHQRLQAAKKEKLETVPVVYIECDDDRATALNISLNKISGDWDWSKLGDLFESLDTGDFDVTLTGFDDLEIERLLVGLDVASGEKTDAKDDLGDEFYGEMYDGIYDYNAAALFKSDLIYDLPPMLEDKLYDGPVPSHIHTPDFNMERVREGEKMLMLTGTKAFTLEESMGNILAFYVDDEKFEKVYDEAVSVLMKLKKQQWGALLVPDFSLWRDNPLAVQIYQMYRARWVARFWQEAGFDIIPSLTWSYDKSFDFCFAGIPSGCPVAAIQVRTTRSEVDKKIEITGIKAALDIVKPKKLIVYGGLENRKWIEPVIPQDCDCEFYWLDNWMTQRHREIEAKRSKGLL